MIGRRSKASATLTLVASLVLATWLPALSPGAADAKGAPQTDDEKTVYFLGVVASRNVRDLALSERETELMLQGLRDALAGEEIELDQTVYGPKLQSLARERHEVAVEKEKAASKTFLEKAGQAKGAKTTESGLIYSELRAGTGPSPGPTDTVKVHYHGTLRDGSVFDSSVARGEPAEFPLNRVIPCWTEGVALMSVGSKAKLICPPEIAYGDRGAPPSIPGGAVLTFEVELLEIADK